MLSGIVLEIACPETLHRSGCFHSHINIIYLAGCVLFTSLHGAHIRSYFVEARDKVTALQGGHSVFAVKLWRNVALLLVFTKCRQWKNIVTLSCHSDFFADFGQVCDHYWSYFVCYYWIYICSGVVVISWNGVVTRFWLVDHHFEQVFI